VSGACSSIGPAGKRSSTRRPSSSPIRLGRGSRREPIEQPLARASPI
jgi:hypothetical protein